MSKPRIIIEVSGGVVQAVYADQPINVDVLDWDNTEGDEGETERAEKLERKAKRMKQFL